MPSDDLKKRIEALNRKPLRNVPQSEAIAHTRTPTAGLRVGVESIPTHGPLCLEDAIDGRVAEAPAGPGYYLIELPAKELDAEAQTMHRRFMSLTGYPDARAVERIVQVCKAERIAPDDILFLDLETTGLGTTPIFLVGTMECSTDGFYFRQYFARDYSEEVSILAAISRRMQDSRMLVTFNGKSFDEPYMRSRAVATGIEMHTPLTHLDLLHEARGKYRRDLPNCKLQTLERMVCGRYREDDIPGSEIPAAYHKFVRTGDARKIQSILQHNLHDLLTMADLMNRLWYCE